MKPSIRGRSCFPVRITIPDVRSSVNSTAGGRGFVQHPDISPNPRGLAVYHQLHCLDAIRRSYYAALDGDELDQLDEHLVPGHVRHCIDYLRQALLCNADTNLEPIDPKLGGVTGFGFPRRCRDPVKPLAWANEWRTHNQSSIA